MRKSKVKAMTIEPRLQNSFQYWKKNMVRYGLKAKLGQFYTNEDETPFCTNREIFSFWLDGQIWRCWLIIETSVSQTTEFS